MGHFNKLPSIVQIWFAEFLSVMFMFPVITKVYEHFHTAVEYHLLPLDKVDYVLSALGLLIFIWLLSTIFRPGVHNTRFVPVFRAGGAIVSDSSMAADYGFSSTHPSYIFIDFLCSGFYWLIRSGWAEGWAERKYQGTILFVTALTIPILRLIAWYLLRLRPGGDQENVKGAWRPVAMLYGFFLLPIAVGSGLLWMHMENEDKREEASLTVVTPENWKGYETFKDLLDKSSYGASTRFFRLRATQKSLPVTCKSKDGYLDASVLATLGNDDDLLIVCVGFEKEYVDAFVRKTEGGVDKPIEVIGQLIQTPDKYNIPSWKAYCDLEKLSPRPRWVFETRRMKIK